jgi:hypothetical protein
MSKKIHMNTRTGKNKQKEKNGQKEKNDITSLPLPIVRVPNAIFRGIIDGYDRNGNAIKNNNELSKDSLNDVNNIIL